MGHLMTMCNRQESISLFAIHLTSPIFASGKLPIPQTMELIIDNCQLSKKQHRLEPNCGPQSRAQHHTLRGRKHIYKTHMSLKIRTEAHARKMKAISFDISLIWKWASRISMQPLLSAIHVFDNAFMPWPIFMPHGCLTRHEGFMGNPHEALPHTRRMKNLMNPQILLLSMGSEGWQYFET